jgi:hypothetical protein
MSETLKELNSDFNVLDEYVRNLVKSEEDEEKQLDELQGKWYDLFDDHLDDDSAIHMLSHYREIEMGKRGKQTKNIRRTKNTLKSRRRVLQKGGMAPIGHTMGPGFPALQTYGSFPSDITSTPSMAKALDIIGGNPGLSSSCGKEAGLWPTVPADMGSNNVTGMKGGGRKTRKVKEKKGKKQSGGGMLEALGMRAFLPTIPQNTVQTAQTTYQGVEQPPSGDPTDQAWKYSSASSGGVINPAITKIGSDINQLASPAPWGRN